MMTDDQELLRQYAELKRDEAFTELVRRHLNLVWGAARRITNDTDLARDVAQTVFTDLARKAPRLPSGTVLPGWLYRAACHAAAKAVRGNARRAEREKQAMELHAFHATADADTQTADALQPLLDEALAQLADADRDAVVLRYFSRKSLTEIGAVFGTSDDAAQKRLARALEKIRDFFRRRGVSVSAGALTVALGVASAQAAPAGLAVAVATTSLAAAGTAASSVGIIQTLTIMKTKLAVSVLALAAGGLWLAEEAWHAHHFASHKSSVDVSLKTPHGPPQPGQMLRPPDPTRRFADFTPEQRVEFARKGSGPGG